ncbi:uncharacterized protein J7T54_004689 [Emericellopsis cladophorae]|uniref:Uncharacterized protein n=1 Tax=Emericellopsis cladophorae TaxID=2686198 RepID=A0A9P9Y6F8_9HYPO|nr:uncharacterized protein J7T54_004689 [Emericellopsis cladophorae]KAI6784143.1 hypothetical protein J7T54_004689 [Emericellopsis cladophorae]
MDLENPPPPYEEVERGRPPAYRTRRGDEEVLFTSWSTDLHFEEITFSPALSIAPEPYRARPHADLNDTHGAPGQRCSPPLGPRAPSSRTPWWNRGPEGDGQHTGVWHQLASYPRWLRIHSKITRWTIFIIILPAICITKFAAIARDDLSDDPYDWNCENHYLAHASEPWYSSLGNPPAGSGRYHSQCRGLYAWAQLTLAVGILSCLRALYQIIKRGIFDWSAAEHGNKLRRSTADTLEFVGVFASAVAAVLYLVSAVLLGTSRLFTGPSTEDEWYRSLYTACLSLVCLNCVASVHQAVILTLVAYVRRRRRWAAGTAPDMPQQQQ